MALWHTWYVSLQSARGTRSDVFKSIHQDVWSRYSGGVSRVPLKMFSIAEDVASPARRAGL